MKIGSERLKRKLPTILSGVAGVILLVTAGVEEAKSLGKVQSYNSAYSQGWLKFENIWRLDPAIRRSYPTLSSFHNAFNVAFNQAYGDLLTKAASYQNDAIVLFVAGIASIAVSVYLFHRLKKQNASAGSSEYKTS